MRRELGSKEDSPDGCSSYINITAEKLKDLQEQDETLAAVRALAQKAGGSRGEFFKRNKLLYRRWIPKGRGEEMDWFYLRNVGKLHWRCLMISLLQDIKAEIEPSNDYCAGFSGHLFSVM